MKKTTILYWTFTILFAAFMIFTAIPNILVVPDSVDLITTKLGFPQYMIPFLGIAKLLGSIIIVLPGFRRMKEWAYAGLIFDLTGATYSILRVFPLDFSIVFMILPIIIGLLSYMYYHKKIKA